VGFRAACVKRSFGYPRAYLGTTEYSVKKRDMPYESPFLPKVGATQVPLGLMSQGLALCEDLRRRPLGAAPRRNRRNTLWKP